MYSWFFGNLQIAGIKDYLEQLVFLNSLKKKNMETVGILVGFQVQDLRDVSHLRVDGNTATQPFPIWRDGSPYNPGPMRS